MTYQGASLKDKSLSPPLFKDIFWFILPLLMALSATTVAAQQGLWESLIDWGIGLWRPETRLKPVNISTGPGK